MKMTSRKTGYGTIRSAAAVAVLVSGLTFAQKARAEEPEHEPPIKGSAYVFYGNYAGEGHLGGIGAEAEGHVGGECAKITLQLALSGARTADKFVVDEANGKVAFVTSTWRVYGEGGKDGFLAPRFVGGMGADVNLGGAWIGAWGQVRGLETANVAFFGMRASGKGSLFGLPLKLGGSLGVTHSGVTDTGFEAITSATLDLDRFALSTKVRDHIANTEEGLATETSVLAVLSREF
ncbi:hypothetical protein HZC07_00250 [Candidatus Micrarchaeota archaeon]|nr:hypothetical protein [Candidatus Micrarchaeota archaeon]